MKARFKILSAFLSVSAAVLIVGGCFAIDATPKFDSVNAFKQLKMQCDYGPRPVGSKAHELLKNTLVKNFSAFTNNVEVQNFQRTLSNKPMVLSNIIARFGDPSKPGILLCAHWDTRPTADQELDPKDRSQPIIGANDGASGVAVLLELAHMFKTKAPAVPVTIVLLDGEDYGPGGEDMFLGSRYFAQHRHMDYKYRYGILLDMVGDKDLIINREGNSEEKAKEINDKIWSGASDAGHREAFLNDVKYTIQDDHIPLLSAGIPTIDVIDFDYAYWHTLKDTPDKCSPESLKTVGETIARVVYSEKI